MIRYLARSLPVFARAALTRKTALVSRLHRRVHFADLDTNVHMNQAVYAQVMELSRADWVLRSGGYRAWRAAGGWPVVAEQHIVYRRELKLGQRYSLDSRAVGIDGRLLVFETHLHVGDRVHAKNTTKFIFTKAGGGVWSADEVERLARPYVTAKLDVADWHIAGP